MPFKRGGRYFFTKNDGLQNQAVLYTMPSLTAEPTLLLDPNKLSADGTVALTDMVVSDDGNLLAYGLSTAGSDWAEWRVRDVRTGQDLDDRVQWIKDSAVSWTKDGAGFYYMRFDEPIAGAQLTSVNKFQKIYYHRLGTAQAQDEADLPARRPRRLVFRLRSHRRRPLSHHRTRSGRRPAQRHFLPRPYPAGRAGGRAAQRARRFLYLY